MKHTLWIFALIAALGLCADDAKDLARGAKATASSEQGGEYAASKAIDGRGNTRWSSNRNDNEWFMVDLGSPKTVAQIQIDWEAAAGKEYVVQFSNDGENFTDVYTITDGRGGAQEVIRVKPQETRFIRIQGKKRATQFGYSIWNFKVFSEVDNLAAGATATASSTQDNWVPANAVDGRSMTRWSSGRNDDEWLLLDLGSEKQIGRIVLKWEAAAGKEYTVQFSQDGHSFTEVFRKTDGKPKATENIVIEPQSTRYIRIQGIKRATEYGYSLWEVEAYAR